MNHLPSPLLLVPLLLAVVASGGCAGYQIGHRTLFRPDIRTVHVPVFQSDSLRRYLGERLTEAVIKELESRSPYKVVGGAEVADSLLTGRILSDTKRVAAESKNDDAREIETTLAVEVQWVNIRGEPLMQRSVLPLPMLGLDIAVDSNFIPEGGQSLTTAQQQVIHRLAREIVNQMEMYW
jgi:hypothetical protein